MRPATHEMVLAHWKAGESLRGIGRRYRRDKHWVKSLLKLHGIYEFRRDQAGWQGSSETRRKKWDDLLRT